MAGKMPIKTTKNNDARVDVRSYSKEQVQTSEEEGLKIERSGDAGIYIKLTCLYRY